MKFKVYSTAGLSQRLHIKGQMMGWDRVRQGLEKNYYFRRTCPSPFIKQSKENVFASRTCRINVSPCYPTEKKAKQPELVEITDLLCFFKKKKKTEQRYKEKCHQSSRHWDENRVQRWVHKCNIYLACILHLKREKDLNSRLPCSSGR